MFSLELSDNLGSPQVLGAEVRQAISAILDGTGAEGVDLVTHSMGGLIAREALRQGEDRVRNLVMIAPPTHGAFEATLASTLQDGHLYNHYPDGMMQGLHAVRLEYGPLGGVRNSWLHELNEDWKNHAGQVRASVIAGAGLPTPDASLTVLSPGDGVVAAANAHLDGAGFYLAKPQRLEPGDPHFRDFDQLRWCHGLLLSNPDIFHQVSELLTSPAPPSPPATPSVAAPAAGAETLARCAEQRRDLASAEDARGAAERGRGRGVKSALAGGALMTGAMATAAVGAPFVGLAMAVVGLAATAIGGWQVHHHGKQAREAADALGRIAYESLNLAEDPVHRMQRARA